MRYRATREFAGFAGMKSCSFLWNFASVALGSTELRLQPDVVPREWAQAGRRQTAIAKTELAT